MMTRDGFLNIAMGIGAAFAMLESHRAFAAMQFNAYQTHSHLVLQADPATVYSVEKIQKDGKLIGLRVTLNNSGDVKGELAAPAATHDLRTEAIKVSRVQTESGVKVVIDVHFTAKASQAGIEFFDYRNNVPSEISLDYWMKTLPNTVADNVSGNKAEKKKIAKAVTKIFKKAVATHNKASAQATAEAKEVGCVQPLSITTDGFAFFKVYHRPFAYRDYFNLKAADSGYKYPASEIKKGEDFGTRSKEMAHYRLALKLYKETKFALVLRTIDFFSNQYPKSTLRSELEFLKANTLVQLSNQLKTDRFSEQAFILYRNVIMEAPESERAKAAMAYVTQEMLSRSTPVLALEYTLMGSESKAVTDPVMKAVYRLASAESLYGLGEYDRAEQAYQAVIDTNTVISPEAAFRIGEVFSARKYWERAVLSYEKAIQTYPKEAKKFSTVYFNLAEAYFRMERYEDSSRVYSEFEKHFSADDSVWGARLRLAEMNQMRVKKIDAKQAVAVQDSYESVINRDPYTAGATMAELRLAGCTQTAHSREFFISFFNERDLKKLESPLVEPLEVARWVDLAEIRFFNSIGDFKSALKRSDEYRPKLGSMPLADQFKKAFAQASIGLVTSIAKSDAGAAELLAAVEHYGDLIQKPEPISYILGLVKARQAMGDVKGTADKLLLAETRLSEANDSEKDFYHLLHARYLRLTGDKTERVMVELERIRDNSELAAVKYDELTQSALEKNDYRAAIASDSRLLDTDLSKQFTREKLFEIAVRRLESTARYTNPAETVRVADQISLKFGTMTELPALLSKVSDLRAQALYESGNFKAAVDAFNAILTESPNHPRRAEFEFMRGKSLAKLGDDKEAFETFRKLAQAATNDVWKKSAQAELDQIQWESNISKQMKDRRSSQ